MIKILQAKLIKPYNLQIEDIECNEIYDSDINIKVKYCGICGSDIHAYKGEHPFIDPPIVLGHEFSGEIAGGDLGGGMEKGEEVTVEPSIVCGKCINCKEGRYNICENLKVMGCQTRGAFSEYISVPKDKVIKLGKKIDLKEGAMIEPLAVAAHAVKKAEVSHDDSIVIFGAGIIGLLIAQILKKRNSKVCVVDLIDERLNFAQKIGVDYTINPNKEKTENMISKLFNYGSDIIFECTGDGNVLRRSIEVSRKGGKIILVGVIDGDVKLPMGKVQDGELEIIGDLMYTREDFISAKELIEYENLNIKNFITKVNSLSEIENGFKELIENREENLKTLIEVN